MLMQSNKLKGFFSSSYRSCFYSASSFFVATLDERAHRVTMTKDSIVSEKYFPSVVYAIFFVFVTLCGICLNEVMASVWVMQGGMRVYVCDHDTSPPGWSSFLRHVSI